MIQTAVIHSFQLSCGFTAEALEALLAGSDVTAAVASGCKACIGARARGAAAVAAARARARRHSRVTSHCSECRG
jgi:hypothetical protein